MWTSESGNIRSSTFFPNYEVALHLSEGKETHISTEMDTYNVFVVHILTYLLNNILRKRRTKDTLLSYPYQNRK